MAAILQDMVEVVGGGLEFSLFLLSLPARKWFGGRTRYSFYSTALFMGLSFLLDSTEGGAGVYAYKARSAGSRSCVRCLDPGVSVFFDREDESGS